MISDIEHDFPQKSKQKYMNKNHLGLFTETHEVLPRLIKTPNSYVFKMAALTEDRFPQKKLTVDFGKKLINIEEKRE